MGLSHTHTHHITYHTVTQESQCIQAFPPLPGASGVRGALVSGLGALSLKRKAEPIP